MAGIACSVRLSRFSLHILVFQLALTFSLMIANAPAQNRGPSTQPQSADFGITCTLQDSLGRPVSGLFVEVRSPLELAKAPTLPNGTITFRGLAAGAYKVTVAGGLLLPPKRVQIDSANTTVTIRLPITIPQAIGHRSDTVSVEQLSVPGKARDALQKAYEAWERNDTAQSRILAMHALQLYPYYGPALSLLGTLELNDGHSADAIVRLQQAVHYSPNLPRVYHVLASAYNESHQYTDALHALSILAIISPDTWQLHYEVGRAYLGQERFEDAMSEFDRAQQIAPQETLVLHVGMAHALLGLKDYAAACAELETVIKKSPTGPYAAKSRELAATIDSQLKKRSPKPFDTTAKGPTAASAEH
jgi:Flp pilus assembly protein TadD